MVSQELRTQVGILPKDRIRLHVFISRSLIENLVRDGRVRREGLDEYRGISDALNLALEAWIEERDRRVRP